MVSIWFTFWLHAVLKNNDLKNERFGSHEALHALSNQQFFSPIVGQGSILETLRIRLIDHFSKKSRSFPSIFVMMGTSGVGKSAVIDHIDKQGVPVIQVDVQTFLNNEKDLKSYLQQELYDQNEPIVLALEEIDKLTSTKRGKFILSQINEILASGKIYRKSLDSVFILMTMNFKDQTIREVVKNALDQDRLLSSLKSAELQSVFQWIHTHAFAAYMILEHMFTDETVSRLAPNLHFFNPLSEADLLSILKNDFDLFEKSSYFRFDSIDEELIKKVITWHYVPAYGARGPKAQFQYLLQHLKLVGERTPMIQDPECLKPRTIKASLKDDSIDLNITVLNHKQLPIESKNFLLRFNENHSALSTPENVLLAPKLTIIKERIQVKTTSKRDTIRARFGTHNHVSKKIRRHLLDQIGGQTGVIHKVSEKLGQFLVSTHEWVHPLILAGFSGDGKSKIAREAFIAIDLPYLEINLSQFSEHSQDSLYGFFGQIERYLADHLDEIEEHHDHFGIILNELHKLTPSDTQEPPVLGALLSLIGEGSLSVDADEFPLLHSLNLKNVFFIMTMNFGHNRFGLLPDPRVTSIQDKIELIQKLNSSPHYVHDVITSLFRPDMTSRILPHVLLMETLSLKDYRSQMKKLVHSLIQQRFQPIHKLSINIDSSYYRYLEEQTIVPSEGYRYTESEVKNIFQNDLNALLKFLPREKKHEPASIIIKYAHDEVLFVLDDASKPYYQKKIVKRFPSPLKKKDLSKDRIHTAIHEAGHQMAASLVGYPTQRIEVIALESGASGMVRFDVSTKKNIYTARLMIAEIAVTLGSRAFERIFSDTDPFSRRAFSNLSLGPIGDIQMATETLWDILHRANLDPSGGTLERTGMSGSFTYARFSDLPPPGNCGTWQNT